jgi:hypothetical protein
MKIQAPDLTQRPPRSARVRLGGYAILPRMLDKGRATLAGKAGEYKFNCPLDQYFLKFAGIDPMQLKKQLALGKGDGEMLAWVQAHSKKKPSPVEIAAWSAMHDQRAATGLESRQFFNEMQAKIAPKREDVGSWFELLDIDDFVTFGGKV